MAGDWIKMRNNLATDPDVLRIASLAGIGRHDVVGRLHSVWAWADEHSANGHAVSVTQSFLDDLISCEGFCQAMRAVGWLDGQDWELTFPDFASHNGESAKKRGLEQKRKQLSRKVSAKCHAEKRTKAGPEKRREEKRRDPLAKAKGKGAKARFSPPTVQDVLGLVQAESLPDCVGDFLDYYTSNGWKVGRNPMRDWKAAYRGWCRRQDKFSVGPKGKVIPF